MTKRQELIDSYLAGKDITQLQLDEANAEVDALIAEMPKKLTFNTEGKINETTTTETVEQRKQWMIDFDKSVSAWCEKLKNENK